MGPGSGSANARAWSTCSNNDFAEWYKSKGSRCLKSGAGRDPDLPNNGRSRFNPFNTRLGVFYLGFDFVFFRGL